MPTRFQDYYATLGVQKSASQKEIKSAFRKIARDSHPDTHPNDPAAEQRFREANEAYEVLGDAEKRKKYDQLGPRWQEYERWEQAGGQGANPFAGFGGATRYRTATADEIHDMFGNGGFSDFFQTFFGERGAESTPIRGRRRALNGQDLETDTNVTFAESFQGTKRTIELTGEGAPRRVEVNIPAGVKDGARVRARGQGIRGANGGTAGDLYIRVHVQPDPRFVRRGDDVYTVVDVSLAVAIAGGAVDVLTPSEKRLSLTIQPETRNGAQLRLRGQGMPRGTGDRGDVIAEVRIVLPHPIPGDLREWAERNVQR